MLQIPIGRQLPIASTFTIESPSLPLAHQATGATTTLPFLPLIANYNHRWLKAWNFFRAFQSLSLHHSTSFLIVPSFPSLSGSLCIFVKLLACSIANNVHINTSQIVQDFPQNLTFASKRTFRKAVLSLLHIDLVRQVDSHREKQFYYGYTTAHRHTIDVNYCDNKFKGMTSGNSVPVLTFRLGM